MEILTELGRTAHTACELANRTSPLVPDVIFALAYLGGPEPGSLPGYAWRGGRASLSNPGKVMQSKNPAGLQAGTRKKHPAHIPDHLPPFPDPHTYIWTPTYKQPVGEYEAVREKVAAQKRDVERALSRFMAKTGETQLLFPTPDTSGMFSAIATKPIGNVYLHALLPKDGRFEDDPDRPPEKKKKPRKKKEKKKKKEKHKKKAGSSEEEGEEEDEEKEKKGGEGDGVAKSDEGGEPGKPDPPDPIDNPYLRPVKFPRRGSWRRDDLT
ncbi:unnamed protein product [Darwinula stevensoni]|uniref:Transcription initiation factor TFIID subunit 8 n=1 Tax=Darwinula stevensoni TaxID=69355 RepID=A0A7R8XE49_9CRUS|nr:unnamed protein product [Darwinula stevensoni]CAG0889294.1 unnamed protein product [Darwinula stevensoni]